jgi:hypothetical protein
MIGTNAVELDIARDYPKLHPVFNVALVVWYYGMNSKMERGTADDIKEKYYRDAKVVDWKLMNMILDARSLCKVKYDFLVSWHNSTVANNTWIDEEHFPESKKIYLTKF